MAKAKGVKQLRAAVASTRQRAARKTPRGPLPASTRGFSGAGRGQDVPVFVQEYVATSAQVCGLWMFAVGAAAPYTGVPVGPHDVTGAMVCADPYTYFDLGLISTPTQFVMALPGVGKSSYVRRNCVGYDAFGIINLIPADIKPDYLVMMDQIGGVRLSVGPGRDKLNVLDPGDAPEAIAMISEVVRQAREEAEHVHGILASGVIERYDDLVALIGRMQACTTFSWDEDISRVMLDGSDQERSELLAAYAQNRGVFAEERARDVRELTADVHMRKKELLGTLLSLQRGARLEDWEETVVDEAIVILEERFTDRVPIIQDVLDLVVEKNERIRRIVLDDGTDASYRERTRKIQQALIGLVQGGRLGTVFNGQSTVRMRRDRHVAIDVSAISDSNQELQAAVLMTNWSMSFAAVNVSHALADAGLEPDRIFHIVMDELHRALRTGGGMVDRLDLLQRVNRTEGLIVTYVTHTMKDLDSIPDEQDRIKARGFIERAGMVVLGGLPRKEMTELNVIVPLSSRERSRIIRWGAMGAIDSGAQIASEPPGRGRFMVKVGETPGIPFRLRFTATEAGSDIHDTNQRWHVESRHSTRHPEGVSA